MTDLYWSISALANPMGNCWWKVGLMDGLRLRNLLSRTKRRDDFALAETLRLDGGEGEGG